LCAKGSSVAAARGEKAKRKSGPRAWLFLILGFTCLILAGRLFVTGASGIAEALGVHPYVIGALVVAVGTSLPELVTPLITRWRGHDDVGLGSLLGSNLFNGLAIVGVAAAIHPIRAPLGEVTVALGFGALAVLLMLPGGDVISPRRRSLRLSETKEMSVRPCSIRAAWGRTRRVRKGRGRPPEWVCQSVPVAALPLALARAWIVLGSAVRGR